MRAVLDACVLYPTILREILGDVAAAGLFAPLWSRRILDEWRHAAEGHGLPAGPEIALIEARFPAALVAPDPAAEAAALGFDLPDPADRHVLATALAARAGLVVTANLRDFPPRAMAAAGLRAVHPDAFLHGLFLDHPDPVLAAIGAAEGRAAAAGGRLDRRDLLRRARLPRLAKALDRLAGCRAGAAGQPGPFSPPVRPPVPPRPGRG